MAFDEQRAELAARRAKARAMGSPKRLEERINGRLVGVSCRNLTGGIGDHKLANWPPAF